MEGRTKEPMIEGKKRAIKRDQMMAAMSSGIDISQN